ncbi:MAG: hypothetical protein GX962_01830 [Epulopiscium sp.]|nr:hypothetical protein [Candidatus Epulonipiscium sp.]
MKRVNRKIERFPKKQTHSFPSSAAQAAQKEAEGYTGVEETTELVEIAEELSPDDYEK